LSFTANVRLKYKWSTVTNTLAYDIRELIMTVQGFIVQAPGAYPSGTLSRDYSLSVGRLLSFPANIRLRNKWSTVTNTLAYYIRELITTVQGFIVQAPGAYPTLTPYVTLL
jgi:hypothetical protein